MSAPLIYETARVPITEQAPSGQPLTGQTVRSDNRVSMDPDTYAWAYVEGPATMGTAAANRIKLVCQNAIEPAGTTTTYTWSATSAGSGVITFEQEDGTDLTGGGLAGTALDTIYAHVDAADTYTFTCALSSDATNPANASKTQVTVAS
jgi:hypothetical protein|tara:strand:- start:272 stop:718 length:447 start_codon:yes stop_codon:yes gene_type:complete